jgi:hypothetical protein
LLGARAFAGRFRIGVFVFSLLRILSFVIKVAFRRQLGRRRSCQTQRLDISEEVVLLIAQIFDFISEGFDLAIVSWRAVRAADILGGPRDITLSLSRVHRVMSSDQSDCVRGALLFLDWLSLMLVTTVPRRFTCCFEVAYFVGSVAGRRLPSIVVV